MPQAAGALLSAAHSLNKELGSELLAFVVARLGGQTDDSTKEKQSHVTTTRAAG